MSVDEWFRNKSWSPEIEGVFFEKLRRARAQRDQYLVIQALTLAPHEPKVSLRLVEHYFQTKTTDFDVVRALLSRAESHVALGDMPKAVESYKAVLDRETERPGNRTNTYVDLPYLIAKRHLRDEYDFALKLLVERSKDLIFPIHHFKWEASWALILADQGLENDARRHARSAIKIGNIRKSGFRYHQDLGLVGKDEHEIIKTLFRLGA